MRQLLRELLWAHSRVGVADLAAGLELCGIPSLGVPVWGVDFVESIGGHYVPRADGRPAIIVPVFDGAELVDLTATSLETRRTLTREGVAWVLGQDALDRAMESDAPVQLFGDPIEWLRNCCRGAVVLNWNAARFSLADLPGIACASDLLAKRVHGVLRQSLRIPPLFVREERREVA